MNQIFGQGGELTEGKRWRFLRSEMGNKRGESGSDLGARVWGKVKTVLNRQDVGGLGLILGQKFYQDFAYFYFGEQQNILLKWNGPENIILFHFENKKRAERLYKIVWKYLAKQNRLLTK